MKRFFTFTMLLAVISILQVQAQDFKKGSIDLPIANNTHRATITPGANQGWWGYADNDSEKTGLGVSSADTYHCAIFIPGDHMTAGGKTINAIRFGLVAQNATNAKVWIASQLPTTIDGTNCIQVVDVPASELGKSNIDVALTSPYAIPTEGVYVGYTFTITSVVYQADAYPILVTGNDESNALILRTKNNVPNWTDMVGQGFGKLFLQVLLEGEFADNLVTPLNFGPIYAKTGESAITDVTLTNMGITPISNIDYTISTDRLAGAEQHLDLESPIAFSSKGVATVSIPTEENQSIKNKILTITKVNGNVNEAENKTVSFTLYSLSEIIDRNVVVEEYTGTGCGWCPRGLIGMEKLRNNFGDRFVGIGIHRYNSSDAMYISSYAPVSFSGAPSCRIDRGKAIDPYYGSDEDICDDFSVEMAIPGLGSVEVNGMFDENFTKVEATATAKALFDGTYSLEFALVADGLKGSSSAWNQSNYYYQYSASQLPEDLSIFGSGGKYGKSSITGWTFNDVAIASSYIGGSNKVEKQTLTSGENAVFSYTLTLPTKTTLKNALLKDQIYVVAILVDSNGKIVNAAKKKVEEYTPSAIQTINKDTNATEKARYTLDGHEISAPQHGINIVKMSDGTVRKVTVK